MQQCLVVWSDMRIQVRLPSSSPLVPRPALMIVYAVGALDSGGIPKRDRTPYRVQTRNRGDAHQPRSPTTGKGRVADHWLDMAHRETGVQALGRLGASLAAGRSSAISANQSETVRVASRTGSQRPPLTGRRDLGLGLRLGAAVEIDPPPCPVRILDGDIEAKAPVQALGTTARHGSSGLTTEGLKIKAGDHPKDDVARSAARPDPLASRARTAWATASQTRADKVFRLSGWRDLNSRPLTPDRRADG